MQSIPVEPDRKSAMTLARLPIPAKALATCIILTMGIGMIGALGQIIVHDIIPTFFARPAAADARPDPSGNRGATLSDGRSPSPDSRGDLFADLTVSAKKHPPKPFYHGEQFVWTLKWTHIHLFGMSMIFIFIGSITIWLDASPAVRMWLVVMPFVGIAVDILAMWLKAFVSPAFFWLHLPGGGLFTAVFIYVSLRALLEMWLGNRSPASRHV